VADCKTKTIFKPLILKDFKKLARSLLSLLHNKNKKSGKPNKNKT